MSTPRMTLPTQLVLRALLADADREQYGAELGVAAGLPSGTIHPILARLEGVGLAGVAVGGRRPERGRATAPALPAHRHRRQPRPGGSRPGPPTAYRVRSGSTRWGREMSTPRLRPPTWWARAR